MTEDCKVVIEQLNFLSNEARKAKMTRFAIPSENALGVTMPDVRRLAKQITTNHALAIELWQTNTHEARILASIIADPKLFTATEMDKWILDFKSWDLCDQCCINLFIWTPFVFDKINEYANSDREFVKRTAFSLIATIAVHHKKLADAQLLPYFDLIINGAYDDRNFVKKAVNWALRQLSKRSAILKQHALNICEELLALDSKSAKWIATNAKRELMK
jgi:3-methyladenine DNA glycosylase AlkD